MPVERLGNDVRVRPGGPVSGNVRVPGSKSLTNRYLTCAALADGRSVLRGASLSDDARAMLRALAALDVTCAVRTGQGELEITGQGANLTADGVEIDVGSAGTAMRFVTALACLGFGGRRLDGAPRMRQRPIGALVDALRELGAQIGYEDQEGYPPLRIQARGLRGGEVVFTTPPSSQFLSALLMVAPYATQDVLIRVEGDLPSRPYADMTIEAMRAMGAEALEQDGRFIVPAFQRYRAGEFAIEPDASAATYFWAAAAITGGCVTVPALTRSSHQGDVGFVDILAGMGCLVHAGSDALAVEAPPSGGLRGIVADLNEMPDAAQTLAVVALFADGPTAIRNVPNLRLKETDRIAALAAELTKLGARVEVRDDGLTIHPPRTLVPAAIATYDDHRMAMSFALAGLVSEGITITGAGCVSKSFPDFFDVLQRLVEFRGAAPRP